MREGEFEYIHEFKERINEILLLQKKHHQSLSVLQNKPFWIWDKEQHRQQAAASNGNCCFNHVVGLPTKDKKEYPLFDYEKILYDILMSIDGSFKDKHLWVLKSTGLGVSEFE
jgi:hypothetical protein